jgi:hypothetical protein
MNGAIQLCNQGDAGSEKGERSYRPSLLKNNPVLTAILACLFLLAEFGGKGER